jgi:hypothetical protein
MSGCDNRLATIGHYIAASLIIILWAELFYRIWGAVHYVVGGFINWITGVI